MLVMIIEQLHFYRRDSAWSGAQLVRDVFPNTDGLRTDGRKILRASATALAVGRVLLLSRADAECGRAGWRRWLC